MYWYTGWRGREIEVMQDGKNRSFSWGYGKNGIHGSVEILTTLLDSIAMEPRALGVSSTLAPWSMNEAGGFYE